MNDDAESDPQSDQRPTVDGSAGKSGGEAAEAPHDHLIDTNAMSTDIGERLAQLEVDALKESLAYWLAQMQAYRAAEKSRANAYSAWWCSKYASAIQRELDARRGGSSVFPRSNVLQRRGRRRVGRAPRSAGATDGA